MLPRGTGKSTLLAAWGLYELLLGEEGASIIVAAVDERQASIIGRTASRMVELEPELEGRAQQFQDRLVVPARGASMAWLPATPRTLEGLDPSLALIDEIGVIDRATYEVVALSQGKRETSTLVGIGTPGPDPENVLVSMREYAAEHPDDPSLVWREYSAAGFEHHPPDCRHCWALANPALDDFQHEDALEALLPPKMREAAFRRARLCQFPAVDDGSWLPAGAWEACALPGGIGDGSPVVLAFDGSFSQDSTVIVAATVEPVPHLDLAAIWEPTGDPDYRIPVVEVEDALRAACRRFEVREIIADPFRWRRSLEVLEAERLPVVEFPQNPARMTPATTGLYEAVVNREVTHSGNPTLARHVANARVVEDSRGTRLAKDKRNSPRRIDAAVAAVMAHARASHYARKPKRGKVYSFR